MSTKRKKKTRSRVRTDLTEAQLKDLRARFFLVPNVKDAETLEANGIEVKEHEWKWAREFNERHPDFEIS